jgi:hypothetical protein
MLDYNEEVAKVEHLRDTPKIGLGEKRPVSTAAALYDLADRYADVVHLEQMIKYLGKLGAPATAGV